MHAQCDGTVGAANQQIRALYALHFALAFRKHTAPPNNFELGSRILDNSRALNAFLASVEHRAYRMAAFATGNRKDALDIVQDSMLRLVDRYHSRPTEEWAPLFFRILQRRILDGHRRAAVRRTVFGMFGRGALKDGDGIEDIADPASPTPERQLIGEEGVAQLDDAIAQLPLRQQQVFLLRELQGFDVRQTAKIMQCSSGTVKTHYFRARQALRAQLADVID